MKCLKIIYFLSLIIPIIDLCLNYNETDFLEYHEKRIKFNVCILLISFIQILLPLFVKCGPCCICLLFILIVILAISGFYYEISSFYLYFAYDGSNKIKSPAIKILLWIDFINYISSLCSNCLDPNYSTSSTYSDYKDDNSIEMEDEKV